MSMWMKNGGLRVVPEPGAGGAVRHLLGDAQPIAPMIVLVYMKLIILVFPPAQKHDDEPVRDDFIVVKYVRNIFLEKRWKWIT